MKIIDNRTTKLTDEVNDLLSDTTFSKMAVGYFYLSGFDAIKQRLNKVKSLKLLIGNSTNQATADELIAGFARLDMAEQNATQLEFLNRDQIKAILEESMVAMRAQLEQMPQTDNDEQGVKSLAQLIAEKRVEVRVFTRGFMHSKAYLFEYEPGTSWHERYKGAAIVGSSNLSHGGLVANTELNVRLEDRHAFEEVNAWFDRLWDESEPFDVALLDVVRGSWVQRTLTPYELYLKTLYELVKDRLDDEQTASVLDEMNLPALMDFQKAAFTRACSILEKHRGVFVADVVGFGKSYIGSAMVKFLRERKRERTLIVCPAKLVPMWERYNDEYDLGAKVLSMGMLKYPDAKQANSGTYSLNDIEDLESYDVVLIDESHNFRNPDTDRYKILQPYLRERKVILLTATPQNKSVWDYYHQIQLFHQQERTALPISTARLDTFFKECEKRPAQVSQLLDHVLIRRRRRDIVDIYKPMLHGKPVKFPKRKLATWSYEIEKTYQSGIYDEVVRTLRADLNFARYGLAEYLQTNLDKKTRKKYEGLARGGTQLRGLIKVLLLKRMESSAQAFVNTVRNMLSGYSAFGKALDSGAVLVGSKLNQLMNNQQNGDELDDETLVDVWVLLDDEYRYDLADFDEQRLKAAVQTDIAALQHLLSLIEPILHSGLDDKRDELIRQLKKLGAEKILIFTEYQDTAQYLLAQLQQALPKREIACATGSNNTLELVRRFAPKANSKKPLREGETEIDILIATDALSEGQNLQDAAIVINYDIHWNPVRLIQRIGRVDRIGSEAEAIRVFNFLPERALEAQLNLQARLQRRVQEIHDVLGEDDKILTNQEVLNEKAMYAVAQGNESILDGDAFGAEALTPLQDAERIMRELRRNNPDLFDKVKALPSGARGALPPGNSAGATFAFCRWGEYRKLYLQRPDGLTSDEGEVLQALRCEPDTPATKISSDHNGRVKKLFDDFEREVSVIQSDLNNQRKMARPQQYIDQDLRKHFSTLTDPTERRKVEELRAVFTGDLERYVISALGRLQRERITGAALVATLGGIYNAFDLGVQGDLRPRRKPRSTTTQLVCSGSTSHHH